MAKYQDLTFTKEDGTVVTVNAAEVSGICEGPDPTLSSINVSGERYNVRKTPVQMRTDFDAAKPVPAPFAEEVKIFEPQKPFVPDPLEVAIAAEKARLLADQAVEDAKPAPAEEVK